MDGRADGAVKKRAADARNATPPRTKAVVETSARVPASRPSSFELSRCASFHFDVATSPNTVPRPVRATPEPPAIHAHVLWVDGEGGVSIDRRSATVGAGAEAG